MSDTTIMLLRLSANLAMFAMKGKQDGIVQQQIEAMGLHQWLCLVAAWIAERVFIEAAGLVDLIAPLPPRLNLKPVTAKIAVPMPIYLF